MTPLIGEAIRRFNTERALRDSERRFRAIFNQSFQYMFLLTPAGAVLEANQTALHFGGLTLAEVVGRPYWETGWWAVSSETQNRLRRAIAEAANGAFVRYQTEMRGANGKPAAIDFSIQPVADESGKTILLIPEARDITEMRRLEQRIVEVSAREQQRIAHDLHDVVGQNLSGMAYLTKVLQEKLTAEASPAAADAERIVKLARQTAVQTRALARGLTPVDVHEDGFVAALRDLAANMEKLFSITCEVKVVGAVVIDDETRASHAYRIVQEAITNAVRHGRARHVVVRLVRGRRSTVISVRDDGIGLPETLDESDGLGRHIMAYRARMIGGTFDMRRVRDRGTVVLCSFPHPPERQAEDARTTLG